MLTTPFHETGFAELFEPQSNQKILEGIDKGSVRVLSNSVDEYFQTIAKLPHHTNRLAWNRISNICLHPPDGCFGSEAQRDIKYGRQMQEFIWSLGEYFEILEQVGVLFEDHFADCVLEISFRDFCSLDSEFMYTPGHKYLMERSLSWLLNITMEGDVYFSQRLGL